MRYLNVLLVIILAGCSLPFGGTPTVESIAPLESTVTAIIAPADTTPAPGATRSAESIPTEAPTIDPTFFVFPTETATPAPTPIPSEFLIQLVEPGPQSKIVSPLKIVAYIHSKYTGKTRIELFGEDGRLVYRNVTTTYPYVGVPTILKDEATFELRGAAESGRLSISTVDDYGRVQALYSVPLLLMSLGNAEIMPVNQPRERAVLAQPKPGDEVRGGTLIVDGEFLPYDDAPLVLELIDQGGKVLSTRVLIFDPAISGYQAFFIDIPYTVYEKTPVRLVIRQDDRKILGTFYLYSRDLILYP